MSLLSGRGPIYFTIPNEISKNLNTVIPHTDYHGILTFRTRRRLEKNMIFLTYLPADILSYSSKVPE